MCLWLTWSWIKVLVSRKRLGQPPSWTDEKVLHYGVKTSSFSRSLIMWHTADWYIFFLWVWQVLRAEAGCRIASYQRILHQVFPRVLVLPVATCCHPVGEVSKRLQVSISYSVLWSSWKRRSCKIPNLSGCRGGSTPEEASHDAHRRRGESDLSLPRGHGPGLGERWP